MRNRRLAAIVFIAGLTVRAATADGPAGSQTADAPKPTGLAETVEKRLVQLDVAVDGDRDAIRGITPKDLSLYVGEHEVQGLIVDRFCGDEPAPPAQTTGETPAPDAARPPARPRATYVFFFDQPHLTMMGRDLSLQTTKELIARLVVEGTRASIVSNARRLETIVPLTGDRDKLLAGVDKLRNNLKQWDSYAATEEGRAGDVDSCAVARAYALEEWQVARESTERLGITVAALAEAAAPKAVVYFGDSLREKAGLHFLKLACEPESHEVVSAETMPSAAAEFDAVTAAATAQGVHFFTVQAEGLLAYRAGWDTDRHRHAQDALVGLAAETGGEAFLGGASNKHIADRIESRNSCRLLLSFPPGDLPVDTPMNVTLSLHVAKVKIHTQGRIVVPSPLSLERARLLAAFVDPSSSDDGSLRAFLIPRGGDGKTWRASVQMRLRPSGLPDVSAELGASIVRRDTVTDHFASSIATKSGSRAIVLEKSVELAPGEFSVVAVARDAKSGDTASTRLDAAWPNPGKNDAAIAPIAVLQTGPAAMSKDGAISSSGSLARDFDEMLDPSTSVTFETVVCRGKGSHAAIVVERRIEDGLANPFVSQTIDASGDPCIQTVDVAPPGRLRPGVVEYRVTASIGEEIVAQERRTVRLAGKP